MNAPTAIRPGISSEDYFSEAVDAYCQAADDYDEAGRDMAEATQAIADLQMRLKAVEAEAVVNGEVMGSNAEQRKAALEVWSAKSPIVAAAYAELRTWQRRKAAAENDRDSAANVMSVHRARQKAHIAHVERETQWLHARNGDGIEPPSLSQRQRG